MKKWVMIFMSFLAIFMQVKAVENDGFVTTKGVQFYLNGTPFYANGFNSYWLMLLGSDPSTRAMVSQAFEDGSSHGLKIARTWAFSDGGVRPLQVSPGSYNEQVFQALDFVISEAKKYEIKLILSLVDNYEDYGGKKQYVEWAKSQGQSISSEDDFFTNPLVKDFYKNHIKTVLTRRNTITGISNKDDPTIMAWELMNEPRCPSDPSGNTIQAWVREMATYLKTIDGNHLVEIGMEGFYGPDKQQFNPNPFQAGTDFISNHLIPAVDFASVHSYPDQWLPGSSNESRHAFLNQWLTHHIQDAQNILHKPVMFAEFGKSYKLSGYTSSERDAFYSTVYSIVYTSAVNGGAATGSLFWQLLSQGMDNYRDGYEIVLSERTSIANMIAEEAEKMTKIR